MTRHILKVYKVRTHLTKQNTEFINFVKGRQDWRHVHQYVDNGYFWVMQLGWEWSVGMTSAFMYF